MASIITLDGVRGATNEYGEELPTGMTLDTATRGFLSWGLLGFAVWTGILRIRAGLQRRNLLGRGRRRRR